MLSDEEKKEILEDAKNIRRRKNFEIARMEKNDLQSLAEYLQFLNDIQKIFGPFKIPRHKTITKLNKL